MKLNKIIIILLLIIIPSTGWGMECKKMRKGGFTSSSIEKCVDENVTCYTYGDYRGGISCIKNQTLSNEELYDLLKDERNKKPY